MSGKSISTVEFLGRRERAFQFLILLAEKPAISPSMLLIRREGADRWLQAQWCEEEPALCYVSSTFCIQKRCMFQVTPEIPEYLLISLKGSKDTKRENLVVITTWSLPQ